MNIYEMVFGLFLVFAVTYILGKVINVIAKYVTNLFRNDSNGK